MTSDPAAAPPLTEKQRHVEKSLGNIREALLNLSFGSVAITVHNDRVVQVDVTEKTRLNID